MLLTISIFHYSPSHSLDVSTNPIEPYCEVVGLCLLLIGSALCQAEFGPTTITSGIQRNTRGAIGIGVAVIVTDVLQQGSVGSLQCLTNLIGRGG